MTQLVKSPAWQALIQHQQEISGLHMRDLFADDPQRFERFSLSSGRHPFRLFQEPHHRPDHVPAV